MARLLVVAENSWLRDSDLYAACAARIETSKDLTSSQIILKKERLIEKKTASKEIGDVVAVEEDGHEWGKKECLPLFYQIDVPGMKKAELHYLAQSGVADRENLDDKTETYRVHRYQLTLDDVEIKEGKAEVAEKDMVITDHKPVDTIEVSRG